MQSAQTRQRKRERKRLEREEKRRTSRPLIERLPRHPRPDELKAILLFVRLLEKEVEELEAETDEALFKSGKMKCSGPRFSGI